MISGETTCTRMDFSGKTFVLALQQIGARSRDLHNLAIREIGRDGAPMAFSIGDFSYGKGCAKMMPWVRAARGVDLDGLYREAWRVLKEAKAADLARA